MVAERARLFVALDLPQEVREALLAWRAPLLTGPAGEVLRPVAPEALHVTLCFLGQVALAEAGAVGAAVVEAVGDALASGPSAGAGAAARVAGAGGLALGEALWLPRRAPRVLTVALDDARGELGRLQTQIAHRLADGCWYDAESRPFLPHVTVARVRGRAQRRRGGVGRRERDLAAQPLAAPPALAFDGSSVALYRSHLGGAGSRYEALARAELS